LYTRSKSYFKKNYRKINFNYSNFGIAYTILRIEYDPNRSSFINLIHFKNNLFAYFLNIKSTIEQDIRFSYATTPSKLLSEKGTTSLLKFIPHNTIISVIEGNPLAGAIYTRAAGSYSLLIQKYFNLGKALIRLKSGKLKFI
jgi:large subunit ribosomal protein L2